MAKRERFNMAFQYLRKNGIAHTQKDICDKTGKSASNVSKAFKGDDKVLTSGFLRDFNNAFGCIFNTSWLIDGYGEMLASDMPSNDRRSRLKQAVDYLIYRHIVGSISELSRKMGVNRSHLAEVLNNNDKTVTDDMLVKLLAVCDNAVSRDWLLSGKGDMVPSKSLSQSFEGNNANNSIVGYSNNNCSLYIGDKLSEPEMPVNKYGDSPSEERKWAPVVPQSMASMPDFDIMGHIAKQMTGGNIEKLYSGTLDIDAWHYIPDSDIEGYFKGDCLGIKAYPQGKECIVPGKLYVIDTRLNGMLVRYLWRVDGGYSAATSQDGTRNRFDIADDDVIRIFRKLIMFRY